MSGNGVGPPTARNRRCGSTGGVTTLTRLIQIIFMIPWFQFTTFHFGFLQIHIWGLFVALGIFVGTFVAARRAKKQGLDSNVIWNLAFWVIISAMIGARVFELFYQPGVYFSHPIELIKVWNGGMSESGGFLGATIPVLWFFFKQKKIAMVYANCVAFALPLGFAIGRFGCFLIHEHPGIRTNFFLSVQYPDGIRLDHGLNLFIEGLLIFFVFVILDKRKFKGMSFVTLYLLAHGFIRFWLDFFRAYDGIIVDARYFGLTPAQYVSVIMFTVGLILFFKQKNTSRLS